MMPPDGESSPGVDDGSPCGQELALVARGASTDAATQRLSLILAGTLVALLVAVQLLHGLVLRLTFPTWPRLTVIANEVLGILPPAAAVAWLAGRQRLSVARWTWPTWRLDVWWLVPLAGFAFVISACLAALWVSALEGAGATWVEEAHRRALELYGPLLRARGLDVIGTLVACAVFPGACEELAFRGVLQPLLRHSVGSAGAIVITAVAFSALHLEPVGFLSRAFLGISFGIVLERTGSVLPCILLHVAHDAAVVGAASLLGPDALAGAPMPRAPVVPVAVFAVLLLSAWWLLIRQVGFRSPRP